jgi:hypothetical protein
MDVTRRGTGTCLKPSKGRAGDRAAVSARRCVRGCGWIAGFLRYRPCGSLFWWQGVVGPDSGKLMRTTRLGALRRACGARGQLRWNAAGPGHEGDGACGRENRRSHDRRRCGAAREPDGSGDSAAPKLASGRFETGCHQREPGNQYLRCGSVRIRGANVLSHVLSPHPPPPRSGDDRQLPRYRGHRHSLNLSVLVRLCWRPGQTRT